MWTFPVFALNFSAQYCPQTPTLSKNITIHNCGPNWPHQHTKSETPGKVPCLTGEDVDENFPCSSTRNINWFLNTLNDCYAQSNIIVNQNNFMDVLGNSKYYNGK